MPEYPLMALVDAEDFERLFVEELCWSRSRRRPVSLAVAGDSVTAEEVAQFKGVGVWVVEARPREDVQRWVVEEVGKVSSDHLVIFTDGTRQDWRWPRRRQLGGVNAKLLNHSYVPGGANQDRQAFERRLEALRLPMDEDVLVSELLSRLRGAFDRESQSASSKAAMLMGRLYEMVRPSGDASEGEKLARERSATQVLARLLFLFFADDTGVWAQNTGAPDEKRDLFLTWVRQETTGDSFTERLRQLFDALAGEDAPAREAHPDLRRFPVVAGAIFAEPVEVPPLSAEFRRAVIDAGADFDWSIVSPAIFGSMFQTVKDSKARRELGEHYTTEENIQKAIGPLFMDELRERYAEAVALSSEPTLKKGTKKTLEPSPQERALNVLRQDLARIRVLDPACGCGNFLVVSYRDLRALELDILERLQQIDSKRSGQTTIFADSLIGVRLEHFSGIEIEEWPARIATTALYLTRHLANMQMQQTLGIAPQTLPLAGNRSIHHADAIDLDWREVIEDSGRNYVVGNPPFLGDHTRTKQQLAQLRRAWGGSKTLSRLDFVTAWHAKALGLFKDRVGEWAFVTTNSITQGDQPARLFGPIFEAGWIIKFAHRTFAWSSEAPGQAAVHCVIVGFTRDPEARRRLWSYPHPKERPEKLPVSRGVNAYLIDGPNVLVEKRSKPLSPEVKEIFYGSKPADGGNYVVDESAYPEVAADPVAARFLRPYVGSKELIHGRRRWCLWLREATNADVAQSPLLSERIKRVERFRAASTAAPTRDYPHHHLFRQYGLVSDTPFIGLPEVSSENRRYLPVAYLEPEVIISNKVYGAPDDGGLLFALASSAMFIAWMRAVGGRMKSDLSLSSTITWNNFPVPCLKPEDRQAIIETGKGILVARDLYEDWSLAELYDPDAMPPELHAAHDALDIVVDQAFGADRPLRSNEERLTILFERYLEMTQGAK